MRDGRIKRIHIFDFDGTIVDTLDEQKGKEVWKEKTGIDWPHIGWWSKPESLNMKIFDFKVIPHIYKMYLESMSMPDTMVVLVTGRLKKLEREVKIVCNDLNLSFDEYKLNTGGPTDKFKMRVFEDYLKEYPHLEEMVIIDDRVDHLPIWREWAKENSGLGLKIKVIDSKI